MKLTYFEIWNFKGVAHAYMDLSSRPRSNVYTLVGLNESGKTTILEALHYLSPIQAQLQALSLSGSPDRDIHDFIPIGQRYNFNDSIRVAFHYTPDKEDIQQIGAFLDREIGFVLTQDVAPFIITRKYQFRDSKQVDEGTGAVWTLKLVGKGKRAKLERVLSGYEFSTAVDFIQTLLPSILYFPNFLFEFPDRIYMENPPSEPQKHKFYQDVLQDVLDDMGKNLSLTTHVLGRAKSGDKNDLRALESVLLQMGGNISATVIDRWNQIFQSKIGKKEIVVAWDKDELNRVYIQLKLRDGVEQYAISERSLGFRWFFAFLLLTHYRGSRRGAAKNVLFLLDEPASNLHPSAQEQLLQSFAHFPDTCSIVYTTHSHYMINPAWLENTLVVKNAGLAYNECDDEYSAQDTAITMEPYRRFVAKYPNQSTYFQPVLEVLDYRPGKLENIPDVVMVEGKNDFYTLDYFQSKILKMKACHMMPGGGAGSLGSPIQLYLAWGREFIVLLDSDKAGLREKGRYEDKFGSLVKDRVFTLADIDPAWLGKSLEELVAPKDREAIQTAVFPATGQYEFNKMQFNRAVQELYLTNKSARLSQETISSFQKLFQFFDAKLSALAATS